MKRILFFPALMLCTFINAVALNQTMLVHHHGDIDIFFYSEIDSILYSSVNTENIDMGKPIKQEIWTCDSVYSYNIEEIDSITFQNLPTIPKPGAVNLAVNHTPYITSFTDDEGLTLYLSKNTPSDLVLKGGTYVYQELPSSVLPYGLTARVVNVQETELAIKIDCEAADLDEIFDQISWVGSSTIHSIDVGADNAQMHIASSRNGLESQPWIVSRVSYPDLVSGVIKMTDELMDIPMGPAEPEIKGKISVQPFFTCVAGEYIFTNQYGVSIHRKKFNSTARLNVRAEASGRQADIKETTIGSRNKSTFAFPLGMGKKCTMTFVGTMKIAGTMGIDYNYEGSYHSKLNTTVDFNNYGYADIETAGGLRRIREPEISLDASFYGELSLNASLSFTLTSVGDSLKSITNTMSYGSKVKGDALFKSSEIAQAQESNDRVFYGRITRDGVTVTPIESLTASAKYGYNTLKEVVKNAPKSFTYYAVPKLSNLKFDVTRSVISCEVEGLPMRSSKSSLGVGVLIDYFNHIYQDIPTEKVWPDNCSLSIECEIPYLIFKYGYSDICMTATMPTGERIVTNVSEYIKDGLYIFNSSYPWIYDNETDLFEFRLGIGSNLEIRDPQRFNQDVQKYLDQLEDYGGYIKISGNEPIYYSLKGGDKCFSSDITAKISSNYFTNIDYDNYIATAPEAFEYGLYAVSANGKLEHPV